MDMLWFNTFKIVVIIFKNISFVKHLGINSLKSQPLSTENKWQSYFRIHSSKTLEKIKPCWKIADGRLDAQFNASCISVPHVSSLAFGEEYRLAVFLMREVCGRCPVVVNHVGCVGALEVVLRASQKTLVQLKPSSVLDHMQWHLKLARLMAFVNKLPKLRAVSIVGVDCAISAANRGV